MTDWKKIGKSAHDILGGLSAGVIGAIGGPAAAQGISTAAGTVSGLIDEYVPGEETEAAAEPDRTRARRFDGMDLLGSVARPALASSREKSAEPSIATARSAPAERTERAAATTVAAAASTPPETTRPAVAPSVSAEREHPTQEEVWSESLAEYARTRDQSPAVLLAKLNLERRKAP